jgi:hypothetical protein
MTEHTLRIHLHVFIPQPHILYINCNVLITHLQTFTVSSVNLLGHDSML